MPCRLQWFCKAHIIFLSLLMQPCLKTAEHWSASPRLLHTANFNIGGQSSQQCPCGSHCSLVEWHQLRSLGIPLPAPFLLWSLCYGACTSTCVEASKKHLLQIFSCNAVKLCFEDASVQKQITLMIIHSSLDDALVLGTWQPPVQHLQSERCA